MEGPLSKWTNVVNGWQYRWFVLDMSVGVLSYYTSKEKMMRGDRRGCVKLRNAQVGIDDEDDSTFTITVDHKTFHFQARDSDERQKWLDALQEARDLHTQNYALLHQTSRLLEHPSSLSEFDRRIVEADAYLQILIDQHQQLSSQFPGTDECHPELMEAVVSKMQRLIELVKKTIVCLQFARGSVAGTYGAVDTPFYANRGPLALEESLIPRGPKQQNVHNGPTSVSSIAQSINADPSVVPLRCELTGDNLTEGDFGEIDGKKPNASLSDSSPITITKTRKHQLSSRQSRRPLSLVASSADGTSISRPKVINDVPQNISMSLPNAIADPDINLDLSEATSLPFDPLNLTTLPTRSYSSSDDDQIFTAHQEDDDDEYFDTQEDISTNLLHHGAQNHPVPQHTDIHQPPSSSVSFVSGRIRSSQCSYNNQHDLQKDGTFDELYDGEDEEELGSIQSHGSVITHLLSQLRIGMDLTRITLPTFILERRSTLEMYADFLAHADLWASIPDPLTAKDRMVACLRWYLSAFHAGRPSSVAKKPYNPTLGEIFRCFWPIGESTSHNTIDKQSTQSVNHLHGSGPVPWAPQDSVVFLAEQVSHHPPVSAFYAEHIGKSITIDGHLWTKSKFLGLSIGVEMVGSAVINLLTRDEEYVVTFPCGYGRNILSVPWMELGGKTSITCAKTGYVANIEFRTKPFYGGKKDGIHAEVFEPNEKRPFLVVEGEWNGKLWAKWLNGLNELFIDTRSLPIIRKRVLPRSQQAENESRRLWEQVTYNLKSGNIDAASDAKYRLEQRQRDLARHRRETHQDWIPEHFRGEGDNWIYKKPLIQRLSILPVSKPSTHVLNDLVQTTSDLANKSNDKISIDKPQTEDVDSSASTLYNKSNHSMA